MNNTKWENKKGCRMIEEFQSISKDLNHYTENLLEMVENISENCELIEVLENGCFIFQNKYLPVVYYVHTHNDAPETLTKITFLG